jgi:hypothetical protein
MKLEIDVSDPKQLAKAKAELTRLLKIVDFAMLQVHGTQSDGSQPDLSGFAHPHDPSKPSTSERIIRDAIAVLPQQFTTSDVILHLGGEGKEMRATVKMVLKRSVEEGILRLARPGQGRKPNLYEKTAQIGGIDQPIKAP